MHAHFRVSACCAESELVCPMPKRSVRISVQQRVATNLQRVELERLREERERELFQKLNQTQKEQD